MRAAADSCHQHGMKFSVYNTMRELSNRCVEKFALVALNETFVPGDGGGADWLLEHLRDGYQPAWSNPIKTHAIPGVPNPDPAEKDFLQDAGVKVTALSRWNNYYVAGIAQMLKDYGANGVYLDEIAYDRITMLRVRNVLGAEGVIDHHANQHGDSGGSPATNYMELFPFIDRLWYGEGFDYNTHQVDYWLVEIAAFPTGLSADLLRYQTGMPHPHGMTRYHYRGLLHGSAFRYMPFTPPAPGSVDPFSPQALWKLWDTFMIETATMIGWWEDVEEGPGTVPVQTTNPNFRATAYVKKGVACLVVVADFSPWIGNYTSKVRLSFDWPTLGLSPSNAHLYVPAVPPFQGTNYEHARGVFDHGHTFTVGSSQGGLLLIIQ